MAINAEKNMQIPRRNSGELSKIIKKELAIFEDAGTRSRHLELVYSHILTVPPTSVEPDRCFSLSGKICTKIRSSLSDRSLDILSLLRSYFLATSSKQF